MGVTGEIRTHTPRRAQVLSLPRMPFRHDDKVASIFESVHGESRTPRWPVLRRLRLPVSPRGRVRVRGARIELA